jgi:hypothetical protein
LYIVRSTFRIDWLMQQTTPLAAAYSRSAEIGRRWLVGKRYLSNSPTRTPRQIVIENGAIDDV